MFSSTKLEYRKDHCFQYEMRLQNRESDLHECGLSEHETKGLRISDIEFRFVPKDDVLLCERIKAFILRHEWLGKMPLRPTHRFVATYKGHLAGVVVMATPNAFTNSLGEGNRDLEKLISRGACISWSPKNLGSALVMFSIRWMVKNSPFRYFSAYSDTEARELGTIYQACNFIYLGQKFGGRYECFDPENPAWGWFSSRRIRQVSFFKRAARTLGLEWRPYWATRHRMCWDKIPPMEREWLKKYSRGTERRLTKRPVPRKHKYLCVLGANKGETKRLKLDFLARHPHLLDLSYPKKRGVE